MTEVVLVLCCESGLTLNYVWLPEKSTNTISRLFLSFINVSTLLSIFDHLLVVICGYMLLSVPSFLLFNIWKSKPFHLWLYFSFGEDFQAPNDYPSLTAWLKCAVTVCVDRWVWCRGRPCRFHRIPFGVKGGAESATSIGRRGLCLVLGKSLPVRLPPGSLSSSLMLWLYFSSRLPDFGGTTGHWRESLCGT